MLRKWVEAMTGAGDAGIVTGASEIGDSTLASPVGAVSYMWREVIDSQRKDLLILNLYLQVQNSLGNIIALPHRST